MMARSPDSLPTGPVGSSARAGPAQSRAASGSATAIVVLMTASFAGLAPLHVGITIGAGGTARDGGKSAVVPTQRPNRGMLVLEPILASAAAGSREIG